jgi:hypothetical protein
LIVEELSFLVLDLSKPFVDDSFCVVDAFSDEMMEQLVRLSGA